MLRELAVGQGLVNDDGLAPDRLQYKLFGRPVCLNAYCLALGVGRNPRMSRLLAAVMCGQRSPPMDPRYIKAQHAKPALLWGEVHTYLRSLYESAAETMPHDDHSDPVRSPLEDEVEGVAESLRLPSVAARHSEHMGNNLRFLPPGTIFEQWRQFIEVGQRRCSFRLFWSVWKKDFDKLLAFRSHTMHSICPVCVKHKLLLKELVDDIHARVKQRMLYDRHLALQYLDRQQYWSLRASSRLQCKTICIILDGMDQAKFSWPRAPFFSSHEFDSYHRPRLHIWGALVHGYGLFMTVSHADVFKGGSTTVDVLMIILDHLMQIGLDLRDYHIHIQLDNTSGSNKNNTVLLWAGAMCAAGLLGSCALGFLRVGHTHEVPNPMFSMWMLALL